MNNDSSVGSAVFIIKVDDAEAKKSIKDFQQTTEEAMSDAGSSARTLSSGFEALAKSLAEVATAGAAFSSLKSGISDVVDSYNEYSAAMNGVKAVASATGNDVVASLQAVKDVTASGLISQSDAAEAIKNLELYGYSIEQATDLIKIMTDAAAYNRQANYSLSEAVAVTTQGIRMENSTLSDAAGITTNIAKMHENYAAQLGKSTQNLTAAEKAQAVYNGYMQEGGIFAGNAESYTETLAGSQQKLETALNSVSQTMGALFAQFAPIISGIADWITENQALVAGIGIFVGILTAGAGLIAAFKLATKAINAVRTALTTMTLVQKAAIGGFISLAAAAAAIGSAMLVSNAINSMNGAMEDTNSEVPPATRNLQDYGAASDSTAKKIANLTEQLAKLERSYRRDLKQIAVNHEENLKELTQQIEDANVDYRRAIDERTADFNVTLAKQERTHQEMVDELMTQLNFLQRYNNDYNKQKLAQVQFALAKEEELYRKQTEAQEAEIALQNEADRLKYEQKLQSLQEELDEETAFMNKHRDALNSVRDVILLDEIESLNERYEEQKKDYARQINEAKINGGLAAETFDEGWEAAKKSLSANVKTDYTSEGLASAYSWTEGVRSYMAQGGPLSTIWKLILGDDTYAQLTGQRTTQSSANAKIMSRNYSNLMTIMQRGYASGGYTGRGASDEVAGVVHRGEYVLPASQVDQNTGEPKIGATQNITINLSGVLATSPQAKRELAQDIVKAIQQVNQSRLVNMGVAL